MNSPEGPWPHWYQHCGLQVSLTPPFTVADPSLTCLCQWPSNQPVPVTSFLISGLDVNPDACLPALLDIHKLLEAIVCPSQPYLLWPWNPHSAAGQGPSVTPVPTLSLGLGTPPANSTSELSPRGPCTLPLPLPCMPSILRPVQTSSSGLPAHQPVMG